ncbi:4a-hydroxytetrahydrobiopterin dehydratase [Massilia sp. DD77]|uniref:4a-hydroxytetrahydrobiopterin dehydratase n=1 Tax=Massilia sp. DD77 TaxID=3109349 RepID=UPI002FFF0586
MSLLHRHCTHGAPALDEASIAALRSKVPDWQIDGGMLRREFRFADYPATIAFVNAVAVMAEQENHHPELLVRWGRCTVGWTTHSAGNALSMNDVLCAAKTDALFAQGAAA